MKRISENYESFTKDELLAEVDARKIEGVGSHSVKADIIAALELNDDENSPKQPPAPLPPLKASPIPQVDKAPEAETGLDACAIPGDEEFTDGIYVNKIDGEKYALCKHDKDGYGRTHSLKNSIHTWQGTAEEFNATFEKE